jgi:hypothetical protein
MTGSMTAAAWGRFSGVDDETEVVYEVVENTQSTNYYDANPTRCLNESVQDLYKERQPVIAWDTHEDITFSWVNLLSGIKNDCVKAISSLLSRFFPKEPSSETDKKALNYDLSKSQKSAFNTDSDSDVYFAVHDEGGIYYDNIDPEYENSEGSYHNQFKNAQTLLKTGQVDDLRGYPDLVEEYVEQ